MTALDRIAADLRTLAEDIDESWHGEADLTHKLRIIARQLDAQAEMQREGLNDKT